ncbi:MAG: organic solvent tolerance protein [Burkholderiales bacterium PBB6]|nr:MAG: organic solvent tolerance protein [Burkholderiales bacterium PBB6]
MGLGQSVAQAQSAPVSAAPTPASTPASGVAATPNGPVTITAREVRSELDRATTAAGEVELRQGRLTLSADLLRFEHDSEIVQASGRVVVQRDQDRVVGREARLKLDTGAGFVLGPTYHFARTGAGGDAARIDFIGSQQVSALSANYTSCPRDDVLGPDWVLSADKLDLDFEKNDGRAEGAVLRFMDVPILGFPVLSFPSTEAPRSGWLPPTIDPFDSRSGFGLALPYYWHIAPNYDATITPTLATRRGLGVQGEFRYLQPSDSGKLQLHALPHDRSAGRSRQSFWFEHTGSLANAWFYSADWQSASDDNYWKDFSGTLPSLTPRLLSQSVQANRRFELGTAELEAYGRVQNWQVLQSTTDPITSPYHRAPQIGLRLTGLSAGLQYELETEANRFQLRDLATNDTRPEGERVHLQASVSRPWDSGWGWITPKVALNAASYRTDTAMADGRTRVGRSIPTFSLDAGLRFDRTTQLFGRDLVQSLEPRLHVVQTPYRDQSKLPKFDVGANDFNEISIYADNVFSGIDRIADAKQMTLGATTRLLDARTGGELLRFGAAQRFLFRDQTITALTPDGTTPTDGRFSDVLLFGSATLVPQWRLDSTVQYSGDINRFTRSIVSARYQPLPFHTLAATYRFARGLNEQVELGWQWPIYKGALRSGSSCQGTMYGVGRINYSMRDNRITDSIAGVEYDAGCWIGRIVAERISTGQSEARQHLMVQLELVGLSRIGSNPLKVLKDNIPGYRLLRDEDAVPTPTVNP